ncbi:uncharacterized protein [Solanum lycopersicum]|uniref:uncharacterized protein n=1 Tax=Solanum lycopersicum TaxID=4081 RepID=UPI003748D284
MVCESIFKLLKKDAPTKWIEECQTAFEAIKNYLSNLPVLVPPRERSPLLLYLSVSDSAFGCYEPLKTYFHGKEVAFVGEDIFEAYPGWRLFFDGAANHQGKGIGAVLVSESRHHYLMASKLQFNCTNNMAEYESRVLGLKMAIDMNVYELLKLRKRFCKIKFRHTPRIKNELVDALNTITLMIKHPNIDYIDPLGIELKEHPVHCSHVEEELDGLP